MQMVDSIQQGQVNMHLLTDWAPLDVGNKASNRSECHIVLSVTATVTISTTGKNAPCCQCYDGYICPEVNGRAPNTHYGIRNIEKKNGIYTL